MITRQQLKAFLIGLGVVLFLFWVVQAAFATQQEKVWWCHTEPNGNSQTLHLPWAAITNAGHADAQGNPLHAGDHPGVCEEPTNTPSPTIGQEEPTATPTPTIVEEVTPTPEVTRAPEPTSQPNEVVTVSTNTTSTPTCPVLKPTNVNDVWVEQDAAGNGTLVLRWGTNANYSRVNIVYGFAPGDMRYSLLNTENDGREEIRGLDNNTHYWMSVSNLDGCAVGEYAVWRDPMP